MGISYRIKSWSDVSKIWVGGPVFILPVKTIFMNLNGTNNLNVIVIYDT